MAFDDDAALQVGAIRANLAGCTQTVAAERAELHSVIDRHVAGRDDGELSLDDIRSIQDLLSAFSSKNALLFKGVLHNSRGQTFYNTRPEVKVKHCLAEALKARGLSVTDAEEISERIMDDLTIPDEVTYCKARYGGLPIHWHGYPIWLALPASGDQLAGQPDVLPARLGLGPDKVFPIRYVLMSIATSECHVPRFADSGGYPYWAPGGSTKPLEQCPPGLAGIFERIADGLNVNDIAGANISYMRTL